MQRRADDWGYGVAEDSSACFLSLMDHLPSSVSSMFEFMVSRPISLTVVFSSQAFDRVKCLQCDAPERQTGVEKTNLLLCRRRPIGEKPSTTMAELLVTKERRQIRCEQCGSNTMHSARKHFVIDSPEVDGDTHSAVSTRYKAQ